METEKPKLVAVLHHSELVKNSKRKQAYKCKLCNCSRFGVNGNDQYKNAYTPCTWWFVRTRKAFLSILFGKITKNLLEENPKIDKTLKENETMLLEINYCKWKNAFVKFWQIDFLTRWSVKRISSTIIINKIKQKRRQEWWLNK